MATRRHTYTRVKQCSHASVELAQARPNKKSYGTGLETCKKFTGKRGQNPDDVKPNPCFGQKAGPTDRRLSPARVIQ